MTEEQLKTELNELLITEDDVYDILNADIILKTAEENNLFLSSPDAIGPLLLAPTGEIIECKKYRLHKYFCNLALLTGFREWLKRYNIEATLEELDKRFVWHRLLSIIPRDTVVEFVEDDLSFIAVNDGKTEEDVCHVVVPCLPTAKQFNNLQLWLEHCVNLQIPQTELWLEIDWFKVDLAKNSIKDILNAIRSYFRNGQVILEDINQDSIYNDYKKYVDYIESIFPLSDEPINGASFILPDGKFIDISKYSGSHKQIRSLSDKGEVTYWAFPTHEVVAYELMKQFGIKELDNVDNWVEVVDELPLVRLNDGAVEKRNTYIGLPNFITNEQIESIGKWLDKNYYSIEDTLQIIISNLEIYMGRKFDNIDDILQALRLYQKTGNLQSNKKWNWY